MDLPIVFEDRDILVFNKSANLVVTPADSHSEETISDILISKFGIKLDRGGVVHRLDKDTSGLLVVAKNQQSLESLQEQFKSREVSKQYLALAHGRAPKEQLVEGAVGRNPGNREKFIVLDEGKEASTLFKVKNYFQLKKEAREEIFSSFNKIQNRKLERNNYGVFSLIDCFPKTGRTHQIRVHLKHIGHPIVSDEKYGGRKTVRLDRRWCPRQFLHAAKIEFAHPRTQEPLSFECPLPADLKQAMENLETLP